MHDFCALIFFYLQLFRSIFNKAIQCFLTPLHTQPSNNTTNKRCLPCVLVGGGYCGRVTNWENIHPRVRSFSPSGDVPAPATRKFKELCQSSQNGMIGRGKTALTARSARLGWAVKFKELRQSSPICLMCAVICCASEMLFNTEHRATWIFVDESPP